MITYKISLGYFYPSLFISILRSINLQNSFFLQVGRLQISEGDFNE